MFKRRGLRALLVSFVLLTALFIGAGTAAAVEGTGVKLPAVDVSPRIDLDLNVPDLPDLLIKPAVSESVSIKAIPLYRCWNGKVHWYTTNLDEFNSWLANGFTDEGITCYVSPAPLPGTVPLYKCMLYNDIYYAISSAERDAVIAKYGFSCIGIEGYVIPAGNTYDGDVNVNRWYHPESDHSDGWEWLSGEKFVSASEMDRHHFYQVDAANISGYNYEGVTFRAWSSAKVLQKTEVKAPDGGEKLKAGDVQEIKWTSTVDGGEMNLYYATDGGAANYWVKIEEGLPNNGSYKWTVPDKNSSKGVLQARWFYHDNETDAWAYANDFSDYCFSMAGSPILLPDIGPQITLPKLFPAAPTNLKVTPYLFSRLDLTWTDNSATENGFTIERKTAGGVYAAIATVGANTTKYSDSSAQYGTTYYYRVKANGNFDSAYSNEASGLLLKFAVKPDIDYDKLIPAGPTGLKAENVAGDPQKVKLSWQASASDIDGYIIERKPGAGDWKMSSTVGADKTSVTESGLNTNEPYSYRVRAYNMFLNSKPSNEVVYTPQSSAGDSSAGPGGQVTSPGSQVTLDFFIGKSTYNINGTAIIMDVSPIIRENRTLLPIRFVTEAIGASIQWFEGEKKVLIKQGSTTIELWIGKGQARINGQSVAIDPDNPSVMPVIVNDRTMMPLRFIAENLGCQVQWIPEFSQVKIGYQGNKLDPQPEPPMN